MIEIISILISLANLILDIIRIKLQKESNHKGGASHTFNDCIAIIVIIPENKMDDRNQPPNL